MITIIFYVWVVGMALNAIVLASIYDDLRREGRIDKVRFTKIAIAVVGSVLTWFFSICFLLWSLIRRK